MRIRDSCRFNGGVTPLALIGLLVATFAVPARATGESPICKPDTLPAELRNQLKKDFADWKIQEAANLGTRAKERWRGEKNSDCPGIAVGSLESDHTTSYAVLLVPASAPDSAYRLVVVTPGSSTSGSSFRVVEQWDKGGASHYFIHSVRISSVFSSEWVRKLHVRAPEAILFIDAAAADTEYEADVYFWTGNQYQHQPIDE